MGSLVTGQTRSHEAGDETHRLRINHGYMFSVAVFRFNMGSILSVF